ncbi:alpha/beta fold hydrolase [Paenibacillus mucilaginosus]|uniref:alpha/beta fold hydrolase n=1 Tax=Paenibacillus mucilaginosus TaxID=61624 RepID=UPI003D1BC7F5
MTEKMIAHSGVEICTESFGDPEHPAVLLIMGAMCSMVYWDEEFCRRLADTGRFVIRYDNRDTGRSTVYEPGQSRYSVPDLADDAAAVLDAYEIGQAHIVGLSLGGMIAQVLALRHPGRVRTLTLIGSSVFGSDEPARDLPPMDPKILEYHSGGSAVDWSDPEAAGQYLTEGSRLLCGPKRTFDEQRVGRQVRQEVSRARNLLSMYNHALLRGDDAYEGRLGEIRVPALIIHGTNDTALPYPHAEALAGGLPNASLLPLEGAGHEVHPDDWETIIQAIEDHTAGV